MTTGSEDMGVASSADVWYIHYPEAAAQMVLEMKMMELVRQGGLGQGTYRGRNRNKEKMGQHNRRRTGNFPRS